MSLLFTVGIIANAQKFALIDMEYTLKNIPAYQSTTEELDQANRQWQSEAKKLGRGAKGLCDSYQAFVKTLSDAQKSKKEEGIVAKGKLTAELCHKYFGPEDELIGKCEALMQSIQDEIYEMIKVTSTQKGYVVVADRVSTSSTVFVSPGIDISDEMFAKLGYSN